MAELGHQIAYTLVDEGLPVVASDGTEVGTVKRVLHDEASDIFDGITVDTGDGERFVDAHQVEGLYERGVVLTLSGADAASLPEHEAAPAVVEVSPDEVAGDTRRGGLRRLWDRITGNY